MLCPSWLEEDQKAEQAKKLFESGYSAHMKAMRNGLRLKKGKVKYSSPAKKNPVGHDFRRSRRSPDASHSDTPGSPWASAPDPVLCLGPSMSPPSLRSLGR